MGVPTVRASAIAVCLLVVAASTASGAEPSRFDAGVHVNVVGGNGVPTNDMLGAGLFGHYRLDERWRLGFALDHSPGFDVERPNEYLGLVSDPAAGEIDAEGTATALTAWVERAYARSASRVQWFWAAGGGLALVDVEDVGGPLASGGSYEIAQEVGNELLLGVSGGVRWSFGAAWNLEAVLRFDRHFTDWVATDRVSGASASVDDYSIRGLQIGLSRAF